MSADPRADAIAILGLMNLPRVGTVTIHRILAALAERDTAVRYLLEYDAESLVAEAMLSETQAELFVSDEQRAWRAATIDQLDAGDVRLLPCTSPGYPGCLREKHPAMQPPLIMARGNASLLELGGIAFAGARRATARGLELTRALGSRAVEQAFTVISGGAAGTDAEAHDVALSSGGSTVVVLPEGIGTASARRFDRLIESGRAAIVSTFLPDAHWETWRAMDRNRTILGLCDRLVVIEAGVRGGTVAAGREALDAGIPTWVLDYRDSPERFEGNRMLIELGARPIPVGDDLVIPPELFAIDGWVVNRVRG